VTARLGWKPTGNPLAPPDDEPVHARTARDNPPPRNGLPDPRPYVWHGDDPGRDAQVEQQVAVARRRAARSEQARQEWVRDQLTAAQWLDVCEGTDPGEVPGYEWRNELRDQP
jgi:hypothetical protein